MTYFVSQPIRSDRKDSEVVKIRREYCAIRREAISRDRAQVHAYDKLQGSPVYTAKACLAAARARIQGDTIKARYHDSKIWGGLGGSNGAIFAAHGEESCRWIESPETKGLRLVGLAHDVGKGGYEYSTNAVDHTGWFLDEYQHEAVCGVVYQLPAKKGKPRYLVGYADPWNTNKNGNGPALLSLEIIEGTRSDYEGGNLSTLRDAARQADSIAERMAETERDYQEYRQMGSEAKHKAMTAKSAAQNYTASIKAFRDIWGNRSALRADTIKVALSTIRDTCEELTDARKDFHKLLRDKPTYEADKIAWLEGYHNG